MLYQAAVVRLDIAVESLEEGDTETFSDRTRNVREIIGELLSALDHEAAPELCSNLSRLYTWAIRELASAVRSSTDPEEVENAISHARNVRKVMAELLEGWEQVVQDVGAGEG
jgi:flagellar biosynthetic protein FliS